jgi:putative ABC transport system permease protein
VKRASPPPRLASWILERALPADVRADVSGDLEEMYHRRRASDGGRRARQWYWRQSTSFSLHFLAERVRDRRRQTDMHTGISWIDLKLAVRMLARYPGLTLVGVIGMAVAITISAAAFTIAGNLLDPHVPLDEGDRLVAIQHWNTHTNNRETRALHDFLAWRGQLQSVEQLSAFRTVGRNLIAAGAQPETVSIAEITASGFAVARTPAALGRHLTPGDEAAGAPDVVVIGDEVWRRRFAADPGILGRRIQLGATEHIVIGVMPPGFAFPLQHGFWVPLRLPAAAAPLSGPSLSVFARLTPGATLESAQAELTTVGQRAAAASPQTHEPLRPRVMPYTYAFTDMDDPENALALHAMQTLIVMLLVLIAVNVAILVYARTATRQGEIAVRSALGASRRRIVTQLFLEALVLAGVAAIAGVALVSFALRYVDAALQQLAVGLPFWMSFELTAGGVLWIVGLTVLAAAIVGIVPALKATGRRVQTGLQGVSAGGGARMQMGRMWTLLIVAQVAVAVTVLPATTQHAWNSLSFRTGDRGFAAGEFLTTQLVLDRTAELTTAGATDPGASDRYAGHLTELERSVEADASVAAVTWSLANPGEEVAAVIEVEGAPPAEDPADYNIVEGSKQGHLVRLNRVAPDFFQTFDVPLLTGRPLGPADADRPGEGPANGILVNRAFADRMFDGGNALGRRLRYVGRSREAGEGTVPLGRWYEIVGVVENFPAYAMREDGSDARLYHVAAPGSVRAALGARARRGAVDVREPVPAARRSRGSRPAAARAVQRGRRAAARAGSHAGHRRHAHRGDPERHHSVGRGDLFADVVHGGAPPQGDRHQGRARRGAVRDPHGDLPPGVRSACHRGSHRHGGVRRARRPARG